MLPKRGSAIAPGSSSLQRTATVSNDQHGPSPRQDRSRIVEVGIGGDQHQDLLRSGRRSSDRIAEDVQRAVELDLGRRLRAAQRERPMAGASVEQPRAMARSRTPMPNAVWPKSAPS